MLAKSPSWLDVRLWALQLALLPEDDKFSIDYLRLLGPCFFKVSIKDSDQTGDQVKVQENGTVGLDILDFGGHLFKQIGYF